ncbi:MAG: hypothetical protein R2879_14750 [Saprospiraceae bacterium]
MPENTWQGMFLSYNVNKNLNFSFYETVIFSRNNQLELQYLNPLILYRTVEFFIGSQDNILIGLDGHWNFLNRFQLYGQWMFDEFKFDELTANTGWWANKFGWQLGLKYMDVLGVDHLDLQLEMNQVRPYTYSHRDSAANYSHFRQSMAHPLGANFREQIAILNYRPTQKWSFQLSYFHILMGEDSRNSNWGTNINLPNVEREMDYGNEIGQGIKTNVDILGARASFTLFHNCNLDLQFYQRMKQSEQPDLSFTNTYIGGGIRLNTAVL